MPQFDSVLIFFECFFMFLFFILLSPFFFKIINFFITLEKFFFRKFFFNYKFYDFEKLVKLLKKLNKGG